MQDKRQGTDFAPHPPLRKLLVPAGASLRPETSGSCSAVPRVGLGRTKDWRRVAPAPAIITARGRAGPDQVEAALSREQAVVGVGVATTTAARLRPLAAHGFTFWSDGRACRIRRLDWAALLKRVFKIDALLCENCGHRLEVIVFLTDPPVVRKILRHLKLD